MVNKQDIVHSIHINTKCHLLPSKVCNGIGVFALVDIEAGSILFPDVTSDFTFIQWDEIAQAPEEARKYLEKLCNCNENGLYLSRTPNNINVSYYINHSDSPNVFHDLKYDSYITIRNIQKGEELFCKYTIHEIDWM